MRDNPTGGQMGLALLAAVLVPLVGLSPRPAASQENWLDDAANQTIATFDGTDAGGQEERQQDRRGKVIVRRIKPQAKSDWNTDPTALPYFFYQIRERTQGRFPVYLDNEGIELTGDEIFEHPIIYFTSHFPFLFSDEERDNLKKFLARGGTLLLDDCTGSGPFVDAVPVNVQRIIPGAELKLMLKDTKEFGGLFDLVYKLEGMPELKEQFIDRKSTRLNSSHSSVSRMPSSA